MRLARTQFGVALVLALAGIALGIHQLAAADGPNQLDISGVEVDGTDATVALSIRDDAGVPVSGLAASDFAVTVDGQAAAIAGLEAGEDAALPIGIVVAVDTSGSMAGAYLSAARAGVASLIASLSPGDEVALLSFDQSVSEVQQFTSDQSLLTTSLDSLVAGGNTALYDAVGRAATLARDGGHPRHAVVFLADGEDFGGVSSLTRESALQAATDAGVPFYVVGVGDDIDTAFLQQLATDTQGRYYDAATAADIDRLYGEISQALRLHYTLRITLPVDPAGKHAIAVSVLGAQAESHFVVEAPTTTAPRVQLSIGGLPPTVAEPATLVAIGAADAGGVERLIDGEVAGSGSTFLLDPYTLAAGSHQVLLRPTGSQETPTTVRASFDVASLPPRIVSPDELPELEPGDIIRVSVASQVGSPSVSYLVDGAVVEVDDSPPFEFVVPAGSAGVASSLTISVSDAHGKSSLAATIAPFDPGGSNSILGKLFGYLLLLGGLAVLGGGAFFWARSVRESRPLRPDFDGVGPVLDRWERSAPVRDSQIPEPAAAPATGPAKPWGSLIVLSGKLKGARFVLSGETELLGRGKFCSVRIDDGSIAPAHLLLNNDGTYRASTPKHPVEVDGTQGLWGRLANGSHLRLGEIALEFQDGS